MSSGEIRSARVVEQVLGFDAALAVVLKRAATLVARGEETVPFPKSLGRVLAVPVRSDRDQPPFNRSTRDGFAVRAEELLAAVSLSVAGQVRAGEEWAGTLQSGQAVEAMTGAPVPSGADAVVMLEHVERVGDRIRLAEGRRISPGENIVPRGSEARGGDEVLPVGVEMTPAVIALAAGCGAGTLTVFAKPVVSVLATGDELVDIDEVPGAAQIRNSNSYGMEALVTQAGGRPVRLPVARDERAALERSIAEARRADLLLLSGGVSMGEYDLVEEVLLSLGAEFFFTGVKMQPGKPLVFGRLPERDGAQEIFFFGLPGNPVSTQVTFAAFVEPLLRALRGGMAGVPRFVQAVLGEDVSGKPGLTRLLPAKVEFDRVRPEVRLVAWQGSGDMAANARANCYAVFPEGVERFASGERIAVLLK